MTVSELLFLLLAILPGRVAEENKVEVANNLREAARAAGCEDRVVEARHATEEKFYTMRVTCRRFRSEK